MKNLATLISFLLFCTITYAQDDCNTAIDIGPLACDNSGLSESGDASSTPDAEAVNTCLETVNSVWYQFTVDPTLDEFDISGTDFVLFDGSCGSVNLLSDCSAETITVDASTTYYVLVGENGDFTITTASPTTESDCTNAVVISVASPCIFETISGDTDGACPEDSDYGTGCAIDMHETIWYEYTTSADATSLDFENLSSDLELAVLDGPCGSNLSGCISGNNNFAVSGGETYYIAATVTSGGGSLNFDFRENQLPPNNDCGNAEDVDSGELQSTCCATGGNGCGASGVWFVVSSPPGAGTFFEISNGSIAGDMGIEIYSGDCGSLQLEYSDCGGGPFSELLPNCNGDFYVHVTSSEDGCGDFNLSATLDPGCNSSDECGDGFTLSPATNGAAECAMGCTTFSCSGECGDNGVWFQVETDDLATAMSVQVNADPDFDPVISIYQVSCSDGVLACQSADEGEFVDIAVSGNIQYFIEVSSSGTPGDFEICVLTIESQDFCAETTMSDPEREEYPNEDPRGPYCPGETVKFCFEVDFTIDPIAQGNNCQWLQGIIPTVGGGWDLDVNPVNGGGDGPDGGWFWIDEGEVVYGPNATFSHPRYELITTADGSIGLDCCDGGLVAGDALPGGWWFVSGGAGPNCSNNGNPNTMWGLPGGCGSSYSVEFCFDLTVRDLEDVSQCDDEDFTDLSVKIFTFADGQTGCWSNNTCGLDVPALFIGEMDCSSTIELIYEEEEICSGNFLDILVETEDGSPADIFVTVIEDNGVDGAEDHVFSDGIGTINDFLENNTNSVQVVVYEAYALLPPSVCAGPTVEIEVVVYPELRIETDDPYEICFGVQEEITPIVTGGTGGPYEYEWSDGSNGSSITLPPDENQDPGFYIIELTVTDPSSGCEESKNIEYEIIEPILPEIISDVNVICKNGVQDNPMMNVSFDDSGNGPYDYLWSISPAGIILLSDTDEDFIVIDDENSQSNTYSIIVTVTDDFDCVYTAETTIGIDVGTEITFESIGCQGDEYELLGTNDAMDFLTYKLYYDAEGDWIVLNDTLRNAVQIDSTFGQQITSFVTEEGSYILEGISQNGCIDRKELIIEPPSVPEFDLNPGNEICADESVEISIVNASDFAAVNWSNGETSFTINVSPDESTTYFAELQTLNNCTVIDSVQITVNENPVVNLTGSQSICPGTETTLQVDGPADNIYSWQGPSEMYTSQSIMTGEVGEWIVTVITPEGCETSLIFTIEEEQQLDPQISGGNICAGESVILDGGPGFDSYEWTDQGGMVLGDQQTLEVSTGGTYNLEVVLSACAGTGSFVVNEFQPLGEPLTSDIPEICNEDPSNLGTILDLTQYETGIVGAWFDENGFEISDPQNYDFTGYAAGMVSFAFRTTAAMAPCEDVEAVLVIDVFDCGCPSTEVNTPPDFCAEAQTFNLDLIRVTSETGSWSIAPGDIVISNNEIIIDESTPIGTYEITYTIDNVTAGCVQSETESFEVHAPPMVEFVMDASVCNLDNGNGPDFIDLDDLIVSGDVGTWSTQEQGITIDADNVVSFAGADVRRYTFFYFVDTPNSPCDPANYQVDVRVRDCACPNVAIDPFAPLCSDAGSLDLNSFLINPDNEPGTWEIISGPSMTPLVGGSLFDASGEPEGVYEVSFTLVNTFGASCETVFTGEISVFARPDIQFSAFNFACNGDNITVYPTVIDLTALVSNPDGEWTAPDGTMVSDPTNIDFEGTDPGEYVYTFLTRTAQFPCRDVEVDVTIEVVNCNCPSVPILPPDPFCSTQGVYDLDDLFAGAVDPGSWTFADGPSPAVVDGTTVDMTDLDGMYTFTFRLDNVPTGCLDSVRVTLTIVGDTPVEHIPTAEVCNVPSANGVICLDFTQFILSGQTGTWTAPASYTGDFSDLSNVCFEGYNIGDVFAFDFMTDSGNQTCPPQLVTTLVQVIDCACPNMTIFEPSPQCNTLVLNLNDFSSPDIVAGTWSVSGPQNLTVGADNILDLSDAEEGQYTLRYTAETPINGCDEFREVVFDVTSSSNAGTPSPNEYCEDEDVSVFLHDLLDGEDMSGEWKNLSNSTGNAFDPVGLTFKIAGQRAGTYDFEYTIPENGPCPEVTIVTNLIINSVPVSDAGEDVTLDCDTRESVLGGSTTSTGNDIMYEWSVDSGQMLQNNDEEQYTASQSGTYTLTTTNMITGCMSFDEVLVEVDADIPDFMFDVTNSPCAGDNAGSIEFVGVSGGSGAYQFSIDGGALWSDDTSFGNLSPGSYDLTVIDDNGCQTGVQTISVSEPSPLEVNAGQDLTIDFGEDIITLQAQIFVDPSSIASVVWTQDGEEICSGTWNDCNSVDVNPEVFNTYCVSIVDNNGCTAMDCVDISERIVRDVYIPNIFDPNSGTNGSFYVQGDQWLESIDEFRIYDRWGELIFDAAPHPPNQTEYGWDGTFNDRSVEQGVYIYFIKVKYTGPEGETEIFAGDITVVR